MQGAEQLDPELLDDFEKLVHNTKRENVQKVLLRYKVKLVAYGAVYEESLQALSEEELTKEPLNLLPGEAKALKVAFPDPASGAGAAPALPLMRDELARGMVDMTFRQGPTTTPPVTLLALDMQEWQLHPDIVIGFAQDALGDAVLPSAIQCGNPVVPADAEATTNFWVMADAMTRINTINQARSVRRQWVLQPASSFVDNTIPDFSYKDVLTGKVLVPAEGKYYSVIPTDDLMAWYNHRQSGFRDTVRHVLSQEVGYIRRAGALHGVITTLRYTFVLKRLHVDSLQFAITMGYRNTQTSPSVPQVLFYVGEQEVKDQAALQANLAPEQRLLPIPKQGAGGSSDGAGVQGSAGAQSRACAAAQQHCAGAAAGNVRQATDARPADHLCSGLQLLSRLAVGQCGTVYLGSLDGKQVVVKSADAANAPRVVDSLRREAAAYKGPLASLCGHCIPHLLYDGFTSDGLAYTFITSFIDGVYPDPHLPDAALHSAAQALGAVHSAGLAHGDVHYNNIIVQGDKAYLIDFGECYPNPCDDQRHEEMAVLYGIFGRTYQGGHGTRA